MKMIVKEVFIDKYTSKVYNVGDEINIDDAERTADLVDRGLAELLEVPAEEPKKAPKRTSKKAAKS